MYLIVLYPIDLPGGAQEEEGQRELGLRKRIQTCTLLRLKHNFLAWPATIAVDS